MRLWRAPPDGSCFFHSVGFHVGIPAQTLRSLCVSLLLDNAEKAYNGLTLREWVHAETGQKLAEYARALQRGLWGGTLEAKLLADHFRRPVVIYGDLAGAEAKRLLTVLPSPWPPVGECGRPLCLLYTGRSHYDALI
jgi:hypothetical protein